MKHLIELEKKALSLEREKNWQEACAAWRAIVQRNPAWEHGMASFNLGNCYWELDQFDGARSAFTDALSCDPSNSYFLGNLAALLQTYGHLEEAYEAHLTVLRAHPNDPWKSDSTEQIRKIGMALAYQESKIDADLFSV